MKPEYIEHVILGGGIAGLGAAHQARRMGTAATIFEARSSAGGLLDNFTIDGFRFDTAVHLSFASEPEVREVFDQTEYLTHNPEALCWDSGHWLKHPAQTNMFPLPSQEKVELIAGLAESPGGGDIANYEDWLILQYGAPIAQRWPLVYTEKYWTVPASELGTDWVGQRMRRADLREVLSGAFKRETPNHYYVKEMRYPAVGGYRAFIEPLIKAADIRYNKRAVAIDPSTRTIRFEDGSQIGYGKLVSSLPLPLLVTLMPDAPEDVALAAASLYATEIDLISVGFNRPGVSPALWFYIYDRDIAAARGYSPDWKSPDNAPPGCSSIQFEIYSSVKNPQRMSAEELKANTVQGLEKMGLATAADIVVLDHRHVTYGNVVFDVGMEDRRDRVRAWVEGRAIHCAGRFGEWGYLWSNQALMSGIAAGRAAFERT
ncbi:MAG TPA: NAD(P)-binding protein [Allosphingosinicella sp.]|nr:NAD(P)-binding protein [Allosphingosinicella sp.]